MKRVIALLIVVAFCISIFAVPISAVCPNPNDLRFIRSDTPNGDEGGWNDPHKKGTDNNKVFIYSKYWFLKVPFFYVIKSSLHIKNIDEDSLGTNEHTNFTGTCGNREPSSPR